MDFCFKMDNDSEWEEAHCWLDQIIEKLLDIPDIVVSLYDISNVNNARSGVPN